MGKFYAIKKGKETGIYNTWKECQERVNGFSGAQYKSFKTFGEAEDYLNLKDNAQGDDNIDYITAYVDGSYEHSLGKYGSGVLLLKGDEILLEKSIGGNEEELVSMRNVAGEIKAAEYAMTYCIKNGHKDLILYYDYLGIENWCIEVWKANKEGTKKYRETYKECVNKGLNVKFIKVKAHSGDKFNDKADLLAKKGLEL